MSKKSQDGCARCILCCRELCHVVAGTTQELPEPRPSSWRSCQRRIRREQELKEEARLARKALQHQYAAE
jgi:hypothetical protein